MKVDTTRSHSSKKKKSKPLQDVSRRLKVRGVLLDQVIRPINDVKEHKESWKNNPGEPVDCVR